MLNDDGLFENPVNATTLCSDNGKLQMNISDEQMKTIMIIIIAAVIVVCCVIYYVMRESDKNNMKSMKYTRHTIITGPDSYMYRCPYGMKQQKWNIPMDSTYKSIPQKPIEHTEKDKKEKKESFIARKHAVAYGGRGNAIGEVTDYASLQKSKDDIDNKCNNIIRNEEEMEQPVDLQYATTDDHDVNEIAKTKLYSSIGKHKNIAKIATSKIMDRVSKTSTMQEPTTGFSAGNTRVNSLMIDSVDNKSAKALSHLNEAIINDKGYSQPESFIPTNGCTPLVSNSRLCGANMNLAGLCGTMFKKHDTENFFESSSPYPPELNIMKGKPVKMAYLPHPDM